MGSRKTEIVKIRLMRALKSNKEIPAWKRVERDPNTHYNKKRRDWKVRKLKIY
jgi:large subunit ribosomal protein L39e